MDWLSVLFPRRCIFCRRPHPEGLCAECQDKLPWRTEQTGGVIAPLLYRTTVRAALHRYKFQGFSGYAEIFGMLTAQAVQDSRTEADVVTWVPCSRIRRWTRGYDQSEKLARVIGKQLGVPVKKQLIKVRHTRSQTKMRDDAERRKNVSGTFKAIGSTSEKRVLLVDDIHTTGATLAECRNVLLHSGAIEVICCTVASK